MTMPDIALDLLRTFLAVAEHGSFTAAARSLDLRQSTVSQHIRRLEDLAGRRLIDRDTHRVALTPDGEALLDQARAVLAASERLTRHLAAVPLRGRLRLGASEDFVLSALPDVLAGFARRHPEVDLELRAGLSEHLYEAFDSGQLDLIFVKRRNGDRRGTLAWEEPIAWVGREGWRVEAEAPLPLLLYPPPSVTRARAIATLEEAGRTWRVAFTSASLTGLSAAARAGLGVMPHSARLLPAGLAVLPPGESLPALPTMEFVVIAPGHDPATAALAAAMLGWSRGVR
ncbi:LysR substrate-binding domain-containing protein [Sphingomonas sp. BK580]|uniref:LysR family transcriptional regulator n=1 Tax=Sphingomonas sp. BK580 TaxID=2586972 RepID=UPI00160961C7|nr:LysR substrate-binding domain-containing protein [Sphingomonas sp. BK580]MBB3693281.1 DNA-binding transcriptional LysR family regulator [Sphingomonas sp. BK580]